MRYLVTGGAGFIGSNIVATLVGAGHQVRVLDNLCTGSIDNIQEFLDRIEFIEGDIRDSWVCFDAVKHCDYVLHQAALNSLGRSIVSPHTTDNVNVFGLLNMLEASRRHKVKRFVMASSSNVYGGRSYLPLAETMTLHPMTPYASSKVAGEHYCKNYHKLFDLPVVRLRYFSVFGPWQNPQSIYAAAIPIFITKLLRCEAPVIFGDGKQARDFTYIQDVVNANLLACESEKAVGNVYNIATGESTTIQELFGQLTSLTGRLITADHAEARPGEIKHCQADIRAAQRDLGYKPTVSFGEGLKLTVDWFSRKGVKCNSRVGENRASTAISKQSTSP